MIPTMTYSFAMAAAHDAANRQMRRDGRSRWNEADWDLMCETFKRLWSNPND
jgi:hypothetical protein